MESLQTQLEESRRWNASLQARLSQPQQRPGTVGGSNTTSNGANGQVGGVNGQVGGVSDQVGGANGHVGGANVETNGGYMSPADGQSGKESSEHGMDGVDWRTTPSERTGGVGGSAYDPHSANNTLEHGSFLPSFLGLPAHNLPDDDTVAAMSKGKPQAAYISCHKFQTRRVYYPSISNMWKTRCMIEFACYC